MKHLVKAFSLFTTPYYSLLSKNKLHGRRQTTTRLSRREELLLTVICCEWLHYMLCSSIGKVMTATECELKVVLIEELMPQWMMNAWDLS